MGVNSSCRSSGSLCPSAFPPLKAVATDWMDCNKELTAAGLHRIHTCFPFNPHSRNESFRGTRLGKDSERRAKKKEIYLFFIPSRILSSSERQSSERRAKKKEIYLFFNDYQIYYLKCNVVGISNLKSCPSLRGTRTFSKEKVRRGFLTYPIAINRTTRGKPLRLQKTSFFESTSP